jgi:predicted  nucleic acid-binding Zn-ribbon protein
VDQNAADAKPIPQIDVIAMDAWLKNVWDRAKKTAELIARLREEKAELQTRVSEMEQEMAQVRGELARCQEIVRSIPSTPAEGDHSFLSNGEREQLKAKVMDLLTKLDGYV